MAVVPAAAFKTMFLKAGKGLTKAEAKKADATLERSLAKELGAMGKQVGTVTSVDRLALRAGKHGKVRFKVKATTLKGGHAWIAKIKGWLSKSGEVTLEKPKLKAPPKAMYMPDIESGGVFSRPTGGYNPYENIAEQNRVGFF